METDIFSLLQFLIERFGPSATLLLIILAFLHKQFVVIIPILKENLEFHRDFLTRLENYIKSVDTRLSVVESKCLRCDSVKVVDVGQFEPTGQEGQ